MIVINNGVVLWVESACVHCDAVGGLTPYANGGAGVWASCDKCGCDGCYDTTE